MRTEEQYLSRNPPGLQLLGAQREGPCAHRSPVRPRMSSIEDCLSKGKDLKLILYPESWELEVVNSLVICFIYWSRLYQVPTTRSGGSE